MKLPTTIFKALQRDIRTLRASGNTRSPSVGSPLDRSKRIDDSHRLPARLCRLRGERCGSGTDGAEGEKPSLTLAYAPSIVGEVQAQRVDQPHGTRVGRRPESMRDDVPTLSEPGGGRSRRGTPFHGVGSGYEPGNAPTAALPRVGRHRDRWADFPGGRLLLRCRRYDPRSHRCRRLRARRRRQGGRLRRTYVENNFNRSLDRQPPRSWNVTSSTGPTNPPRAAERTRRRVG